MRGACCDGCSRQCRRTSAAGSGRCNGWESAGNALRSLQAVDGGLDRTMDDALAHESKLFGDACASEDKGEGTRAFLEKRPPVFHGR